MRGRIRRAFETGEFTVVADWRLQREHAPVASKSPDVLASLSAASEVDRLDIMVASVVQVASAILGLPEDYVERDRPLRELGFDSVQAVELAEEVGNATS